MPSAGKVIGIIIVMILLALVLWLFISRLRNTYPFNYKYYCGTDGDCTKVRPKECAGDTCYCVGGATSGKGVCKAKCNASGASACPGDTFCGSNGQCGAVPCQTNNDCAPYQSSCGAAGNCTKLPASCGSSPDCPFSFYCLCPSGAATCNVQDGKCMALPSSCTLDSNCPQGANFACVSGLCLQLPPGCTGSGDPGTGGCPAGFGCNSGFCLRAST